MHLYIYLFIYPIYPSSFLTLSPLKQLPLQRATEHSGLGQHRTDPELMR